MTDMKEISSWDLIEGVKTATISLPLALYGAARVERKPLKYEEQFQLVQMHSHKQQLPVHNFVYIADQKDLPAADGIDASATQEGEMGGTETLASSSSEQSTNQDAVKKPQSNVNTAMPQQQRGDHMILPPGGRGQQMPGHMAAAAAAAAAASLASQMHHNPSAQPTGAVGSGPMAPANTLTRHPGQMPHQPGYHPAQRMMAAAGGGYQTMQKASTYPPPYQPRSHELIQQWSGGPGVGAYDTKKREQLRAIQSAAIQSAAVNEAKKQQILNPMQQSRSYGTAMGGQHMAPRAMGNMQVSGMLRNQIDYLNQFPAEQRNAVYQQMLRKQRQQQQMQAMQQHQHPGMQVGGAVRPGFVRQTAGYSNPMVMRPRVGIVQQSYGLQQQQAARQQQLFQIQQQQQQFQQQQQQFGGGAGYSQY